MMSFMSNLLAKCYIPYNLCVYRCSSVRALIHFCIVVIAGSSRFVTAAKDYGPFRQGNEDKDRAKAAVMDMLCDDLDEDVEILDDVLGKEALVGVEPSLLTKAEKAALVAPGSRLTLSDVRWPGPDERPCPPKGYTVALKAWFEVGLGLPIHPFIQTLVRHY